MTMKLRRWQSEAVKSALGKFKTAHPHFLCLATPGAGKTMMASVVARQLMETNQIGLVLCFSPSVNVCTAFQLSLEQHLNCRLDGLLGSKGRSLTYQSMLNLDQSFWSLLAQFKTLVIFDEIHHCAGDDLTNANAWGQKIIQQIQGRATYTLALTGTPWRSDKVPIALSTYCRSGKIQCDFSYGLDLAIKDRVCRIPKVTAIDNERISVISGAVEEKYSSFADLLKHSHCAYQQLLGNNDLISYLINATAKKLNQVRKKHREAGALIVAASVEHAFRIADILKRETGDDAYIVTYMHDDAQNTISRFREANDKWIISVGMISEGTDIPRLRVCCHLTRVKTELYFRQVLGRILRSNGTPNEESYLFMPAEPNLIEFARRVDEDIPEDNTVTIEQMELKPTTNMSIDDDCGLINTKEDYEISLGLPSPTKFDELSSSSAANKPYSNPNSTLSEAYDATIGLFGRFKQQIIHSAAFET